MQNSFRPVTGGVASLNHRLMAANPSGSAEMVSLFTGYRWCRFAQPPANGCEPFGFGGVAGFILPEPLDGGNMLCYLSPSLTWREQPRVVRKDFMINYSEPDLTQHPPRSPRVRLGGFAHLPRLLDKARAVAAGKHGLYEYGAMMDRHFFTFAGIDAVAFLEEVKKGRSDLEMLRWVTSNLRPTRHPCEIVQWSEWLESIGPATASGHEWLAGKMKTYGPERADVQTYCDHLDIDDYVSFGGQI